MDILEQLESKILNTISSVEDLQLENMQLQEDLNESQNALHDKQQQWSATNAQLVESDAERLTLRSRLEESTQEVKALQHEKTQLSHEHDQLMQEHTELKQDAEKLQQLRVQLQDEKVQLMEEKQQFVTETEQLKKDVMRLNHEKNEWANKAASILKVLESADLLKQDLAQQAKVDDGTTGA